MEKRPRSNLACHLSCVTLVNITFSYGKQAEFLPLNYRLTLKRLSRCLATLWTRSPLPSTSPCIDRKKDGALGCEIIFVSLSCALCSCVGACMPVYTHQTSKVLLENLFPSHTINLLRDFLHPTLFCKRLVCP